MCPPVAKVCFEKHLVLIYKILLFTGLIHLKYDSAERRVRSPWFLRTLVQIAYRAFHVVYGVAIFFIGVMLATIYMNLLLPQGSTSAINVHDGVLVVCQVIWRVVTSYALASNYLSRGHCLRSVVNELLDIFDRLKTHTDSLMYFDRSLLLVALLKLFLTAARVRLDGRNHLAAARWTNDVLLPYSYLLNIMTCFTCMYSQLVLICFYLKMNAFLAKVSGSKESQKLARRLRELIAISNRIHRAKAKLDWFFTAFYATWYLGLVTDVHYTYETLKIFVYVKRKTSWRDLVPYLARYLPVCFMVTFDIYALGRLSDMLSDSATAFKHRVVELSERADLRKDKRLQRAVELMAHQDWLRDARTLAFENVQLNRKFAFECLLGVIVVSVFTSLKYYAATVIYTQAKRH